MGGGNLLPQILANSDAVPDGVDLSQCYVIKVNPKRIGVVEYTTSSQTSRAQSYNIDDTHRVYYIPVSEEPVLFTIVSADSYKYGIKSITTESGKSLTYGPSGARIRTSYTSVKPGDPIIVEDDLLENIQTGTLTVTLLDDAENVYIYNCTANYRIRTYTKKDFANGTLTIKYDPKWRSRPGRRSGASQRA